jgi:hypothetical protein
VLRINDKCLMALITILVHCQRFLALCREVMHASAVLRF